VSGVAEHAEPISSAASGEAKPPEMPSDHSSPAKSPLATAEVASSAPEASASARSGGPAPRAPRPATNTGRRAARMTRASSATAAGSGRADRGGGGGTTGAGCAGAAWTSSGRLSTTVRRSWTAVRYARTVSATAEPGECTRSGTAPTAAIAASWSMRKLFRTAAPGVSAARTSSGVRLLAASVMPVSALVSPQPWWVVTTASRSLIRA
jgi:hypothetical protein